MSLIAKYGLESLYVIIWCVRARIVCFIPKYCWAIVDETFKFHAAAQGNSL